MRKKIFMLIAVFLLVTGQTIAIKKVERNNAQTQGEMESLQTWKAGRQISQETINRYGWKKCFVSMTINDSIFKRIYGHSFKRNCTVPRSQLRYLKVLHYTIDGKIQLGEIICNKTIANDLLDIFRNLYNAKYPIERMILIDEFDANDLRSMEANNTACFNFRPMTGAKKLSNHALGKAIDINPLYNPYVKHTANGTIVKPLAGKPYIHREKSFNYKIDHNDLCYKEFIKHGFQWGGAWKSLKDYQHFEKN